MKEFHKYLYGQIFLLVTDHKALTTVLGPKTGVPALAAAEMQRWALTLSAYHYDIQFKPTAQHGNADGLSRLPLLNGSGEEEMGETAATHIINLKQISKLSVTAARLKEETASDPVLSKILRYAQEDGLNQLMISCAPSLSTRKNLQWRMVACSEVSAW